MKFSTSIKPIDIRLRPAKPKTNGPGQGQKRYDIEWGKNNKWQLADYIYNKNYGGLGNLKQFGKACKFANGTLDKFEEGISRAISMKKFIKIAEQLGVDPKIMAKETNAKINVEWPSDK
jgi:hypothetical protein